MPREKEFSTQEVLAKAADVFTRYGYAGTSFATLTQELGVAKQSLYNAFGDKEALYLQSLQHTMANNPSARALADRTLTGRARVARFFSIVILECNDPRHPGCMVSNGLLEISGDSLVARELQSKWAIGAEMLRSAIEDGQRDGSVQSKLRSAELAQALMVAMSGLRVLAKAHGDAATKPQVLQSSLDLSLSVLDR
jgi:TetR/AcrR family transcriptional regulator, transcriptional repressor for nem operon